MTVNGWLQIAIFFFLILLTARPLGRYMARVFEGRKTLLDPLLLPAERLLYRLTGVRREEEMRWTEYGAAMLLFSLATALLTYVLERTQHVLPWNPQHLANVSPALAWNTAISFTTNTNWQSYAGESTMSYLTQMLGLATHNFWSAATGIALAVAFIRGIARREMKTLGNFWVDLTRATLWVLLPISIVLAFVLVSQGVIQNLRPYDTARILEPSIAKAESQTQTATGPDGKATSTIVRTQTIAQGPVASQEAIKMLGTNGGGFFNANSAHPFENPTPLSNLVEMFAIFLIPAALTVTLGQMTGSPRHGWAVFGAMAVLWFAGVFTCYWAESQPNPSASWRRSARFCESGGRKHGGQGGSLRHCELRALRNGDDGRELRRGELHARFVHAAGRHGAAGQHHFSARSSLAVWAPGSTACWSSSSSRSSSPA